MTSEQIEFRKALHKRMDEGKRYKDSAGNIIYRDDDHKNGPYVFISHTGAPNSLDGSWNYDAWQEIQPEPEWYPKPDELVLCRDWDNQIWRLNRFSNKYIDENFPFMLYGTAYREIAPYAGNESMLGQVGEIQGSLK